MAAATNGTTTPVESKTADRIQTRRPKYAQVPEWILYHPKIGNRAKVLYCALDRHTNKDDQAFPSRKTLGSLLRCSRDSIDRDLKELQAAGAVMVEPCTGKGGRQTSNTYTLAWGEPFGVRQNELPMPRGGRTGAAGGGRTAAAPGTIAIGTNECPNGHSPTRAGRGQGDPSGSASKGKSPATPYLKLDGPELLKALRGMAEAEAYGLLGDHRLMVAMFAARHEEALGGFYEPDRVDYVTAARLVKQKGAKEVLARIDALLYRAEHDDFWADHAFVKTVSSSWQRLGRDWEPRRGGA